MVSAKVCGRPLLSQRWQSVSRAVDIASNQETPQWEGIQIESNCRVPIVKMIVMGALNVLNALYNGDLM